mmetsp:Transcript_28143/g.97351  ORF Transcript_28143/g.97351 Transcript_28143/m.97351 type:complete len:216 (+) Transcript_28143:428-1075(+)
MGQTLREEVGGHPLPRRRFERIRRGCVLLGACGGVEARNRALDAARRLDPLANRTPSARPLPEHLRRVVRRERPARVLGVVGLEGGRVLGNAPDPFRAPHPRRPRRTKKAPRTAPRRVGPRLEWLLPRRSVAVQHFGDCVGIGPVGTRRRSPRAGAPRHQARRALRPRRLAGHGRPRRAPEQTRIGRRGQGAGHVRPLARRRSRERRLRPIGAAQ